MNFCRKCGNIFPLRADGRGYSKRALAGPLRNSHVTVVEALQLAYDYNVITVLCYKFK